MNLKNYTIVSILLLQASAAMAVTIGNPTANKIIDKNNLTVEVNGACKAGIIYKISAKDSANKATSEVWTQCQPWGYSVQVNISALKDGNITVQALQNVRRRPELATVVIVKNTGVVVTPPVVVPPVTPPVVVPPVVTPPVTPPVATTGIVYGVNGHDKNQATYPLAQAEARFKILDARNLRSYRFDLLSGNTDVLNTLIPLAKKYNITLRPMLYPTSQANAYNFVKPYVNDIKVWEIGNEQDYSKDGAQVRINAMVATYKGIKQASDETGAGLKTTINIMACNSEDMSAGARCPGDKNGALWFIDMAKASGFNFDFISFHWYPYLSDKGYWMDLYLGQMRTAATKYKVKIMYNELNCGDVYQGTTDGGRAGDNACYDSVKQIFDVIRASQSDIVQEINMYEMLDEPDHPVTHEKHFGMMYNINNPKAILDLVTEYANKK